MTIGLIGIAATAPHSETEIAPNQPTQIRPARSSPVTWSNWPGRRRTRASTAS
jgi:hypothetical protein